MVDLAFARGREGLDQQIWHQIEIDVPRTRPGVRLWMHAGTQRVRVMRLNPAAHHTKIRCAEPGTYSLRMGYTASSKWICARNQ